LPPGLRPRLSGARRAVFTTDIDGRADFLGLAEDSWKPEPLPTALVPMAQSHLAELERYLEPVSPEEEGRVLARIMALLEHYPGRARSDMVEQALALDWADDLCEYPAWAVGEACRRWRRDPSKAWRPTPGQIRAICDELVAEARLHRDRLKLVLRASR